MYICKIIAEIKEDCEYLRQYVGKYPVNLCNSHELCNSDEDVPVLIVGWSTVKIKYPNQNILDKKISNSVSWIFSKTEYKEDYDTIVENFINDSIKSWLPNDFILLDPVFQDKHVYDLINENIDNLQWSYLYFHKNALYIRNNNKNFILNIGSLSAVEKDYKNNITLLLNTLKCICVSYKNISDYVNLDKLNCIYTFENAMWVKYGKEIQDSYFSIIPNFDFKKYIPFIMSKLSDFEFSDEEKRCLKRACEKDNITQWLSDRTICLSKEMHKNNVDYLYVKKNKLTKVNYSNKRTLTGRIVAVDSFNPQNLPKDTEDRKHIVSRFDGGKIVVFDYTSFEARIAVYFCDDHSFIDEYYDKDIHYCTAKIVFQNKKNISEKERDFGKLINNQMLYGASKESVMKNLSFLENSDETYFRVKDFLKPLLIKFKEKYEEFKLNGYIINPWGTIVRPEKDYASYNNFMQSSAVEILVDQLYKIKKFISSYKSQFVFQVHDSLVFDIHPDEHEIVKNIAKILMNYNKMYFTMKYSSGYNYKELNNSTIIAEKKI